ncbi:type II secretion system protein M [Spartinivicinus poritis]|uniref:Type II secretion system protein M n=1 Tax=Spartinivicinus poritis TaxID=2994640 RepID=A0ABT5UBV0_9GAMM|nr:type II secretion system protein M [Spartinivicinus sp. A2-2]MDE1463855.1 type II secretion system protein M [Spartinivicinus sp. A2-2]
MIQQYWQQMSANDRRALMILSGFILIAGLYLLIWKPLASRYAAAESDLAYWQEAYQFMEQRQQQAKQLGGQNQRTSLNVNQLRQLITTQAAQHGLTINRLEPGQRGVTLWLEKVPFTSTLKWLNLLATRHQVNVKAIQVSRQSDAGVVNIRAEFPVI